MPSSTTFVRKSLMRLSWPLLVVTVVTLLAALVNVVLLSAASPELNAAVATANQILGILYDISVLFSIGALVVIAQYLGARRFGSAQRTTIIALRASTLLGVGIAVFVAVGGAPIVAAINTPAEIADDANAYLWIVAAGMAFNAYIVAASAVLRAYGRTVALLVLGIVVNLLDVVLLSVFLLVLELGVVGAALPTLLVRGVGMLLLAWMVRRRTGVGMFSKLPEKTAPQKGAATMARLSVPTVIENGVFNLSIVFVLAWINLLGTDAINARSYTLTLTALVTGVILALAQGNETVVGWDVGDNARDHARRLTLRTAAWTAGASAVLTLALWLSADYALAIFGANEAVVAMVRDVLLVSAVLLPLSAVSSVVFGALRSAGDVVMPMVYSIVASVAVLVPVSWLLIEVAGLGLVGAFWGLVVAEAVKAGLLTGRWVRGTWMRQPTVAEGADDVLGESEDVEVPVVAD
ncbi:MAG TPA: MATE family efflux transporter [Terrimesophilobacter sp.]|nr:MATE family efflux transporter [Terrimesophilobacter sp.]HRP99599.1 MATE family efflux transporter [Terrimesophilobacter sp.]